MSAADLAAPLRDAIVADSGITALLPAYQGSYPVFSQAPVPNDAPFPQITISPPDSIADEDGVNDFRPLISQYITAWAENSSPANGELADDLGYLLRDLFHRQRSIVVPGWSVVDIQVQGPQPTFVDDQRVGVAVFVQTRLAKLR